MGKTWFDITKNWIILLQLDPKHIHKVTFYPSDKNFTQALLVMLVTNMISGAFSNYFLNCSCIYNENKNMAFLDCELSCVFSNCIPFCMNSDRCHTQRAFPHCAQVGVSSNLQSFWKPCHTGDRFWGPSSCVLPCLCLD